MVFLQNDFYTASGPVRLYNCWTDKVTKFDTSSFYNWEQDNLPIYDLEERTYYLWEKLGHPTSSIPGISMVVSAGASPELYACNPYLYETVSAAIAALPEVLNYPVIIEVCNKGNLGDINLNNIKCSKNGVYKGSLEIVNRVFAKSEPYKGTAVQSEVSVAQVGLSYSLLGYLSGTTELGARRHFLDTKSVFLNQKILPNYSDITSLSFLLNCFTTLASDGGYSPATYAIGTSATNAFGNNIFQLSFYESTLTAQTVENIFTYDISSFNQVNNAQLLTKSTIATFPSTTLLPFVGLFMGNSVSKINITNCDGPIYIRNFFVDGRGPEINNSYGVTVNNSENIFLENCVSVRNRKAGFFFNNSNVIITRGIAAYRNYNSPRDVTNVSSTYEKDLGAGLLAVNSNVSFSSTSAFEYAAAIADSTYSSIINSPNTLSYGLNYPINFCRNANGIVLENSKLHGGIKGTSPTQLISDMNTFVGIKMTNSELDWDGRLILEANDTGLLATNSIIKTDKHIVRNNQKVGIDLNDSMLVYNKNFLQVTSPTQFYFSGNGVHLDLDNSNYECDIISGMPSAIGQHKFENSHGVSKTSNSTGISLPSIRVTNSSKCLLIHPYIIRQNNFVKTNGFSGYFEVKEGLAILTRNNSTTTLKGSGNYANIIVGPAEKTRQHISVGLHAENNSTINIQGPTAAAQFSINVLADNNSVLNITPHQDESNKLEIQEFDLSSPRNHTMVELHSTRACLLANKNSTINITNLGNYLNEWTAGSIGSNFLASNLLDLNYYQPYTGLFTSGGFLQFYPNPFATDVGTASYPVYEVTSANFANNQFTQPSNYYLFNRSVTSTGDFTQITNGGFCVKAHNNSTVNVKGVNFPCGWWNPSSIVFDADTFIGNCSKLFIWNIADDSKLLASYCSVSGMYPADASYNGPPAVWLSALNNDWTISGSLLSGAPTGTPDTSSLSILDYFGSGPSSILQSYLFTSSFQNKGPFRLFFSVDPASQSLKLMSNLAGLTYNDNYTSIGFGGASFWLYQLYSQGYQPPFSASAISSVSSSYKNLINSTTKSLSGFYYGSSMVYSPNNIKCILDESASNTFANAKHCGVGKSGLPKLVSLISSTRNVAGNLHGEGTGTTVAITGLGSLNIFDLNRYI